LRTKNLSRIKSRILKYLGYSNDSDIHNVRVFQDAETCNENLVPYEHNDNDERIPYHQLHVE